VSQTSERVVFDCNIHVQAVLNPRGGAGACLALAKVGRVELFASEQIMAELREMPGRERLRKLGLSIASVEKHIARLAAFCRFITVVPSVFVHPIDPDDSLYVDLAVAVGAKIIVSRDRHLLNLIQPSIEWSKEFRERFPELRIVSVETFLAQLCEGKPHE
jgi:putative PIN family toxin of toxin-antitoxin system